MQTPNFEIPAEMRDFAEKSVDQARTAVGTMMANAIKAAEQVQTNSQTFQSTLGAAVAKGLDHAQTNANATFDFAQKLVRTKDLREAFELQSDFVRSQFAALQAQAKDIGSLAQNAAR
ncbi:phasin [Methylobacterium sp. NEAU 140]|uniref:phasin n=1 Tax=Methylobacterium sp. NEAU 140 TaxID=3064945 RepID=UPI00273676D1|nr:phasin [Methylobacterium sp. NEAU 140]MDP4021675.1 phasin [Methylobacterium sp. NEAU 140]